MKIRALLFDIDDCLFPSTEFTELARKNAVNAMIDAGLDFPAPYVYKRLQKIISRHGSNATNHFNLLLNELDADKKAKIIASGIVAYHNTKTAISPFPEVKSTLLKLREAGYKLYVASDGNAIKQWDKLIRLGLYFLFDDVFVSEEIGCEKSLRFFKIVLGKLKLKPNQVIVIGDRLDRDIGPANDVGISTIRLLEGKYSKQKGIKPDFTITNIRQVLDILKKVERYGRGN